MRSGFDVYHETQISFIDVLTAATQQTQQTKHNNADIGAGLGMCSSSSVVHCAFNLFHVQHHADTQAVTQTSKGNLHWWLELIVSLHKSYGNSFLYIIYIRHTTRYILHTTYYMLYAMYTHTIYIYTYIYIYIYIRTVAVLSPGFLLACSLVWT